MKEGLIQAIYVVNAERSLADVAYDEPIRSIYKMAASNIICMLLDEVQIQCGDDSVIELKSKYL